ncbi:hypothetical protein THIOM_001301 [Candidatus Thiomargarita nelsonii]|uniref:Uncharacterized protein n=1 Tax=Candidatus Thiomargarita nelsonii TaxID=1003181 RepID=A0A176S4L1_9GAMM|nr:hypothetical protein THIOM_001301 [Candidatus Thiomargarita nelsonii]
MGVWRIQWGLSLGMFPILLFIFGYVPLSRGKLLRWILISVPWRNRWRVVWILTLLKCKC